MSILLLHVVAAVKLQLMLQIIMCFEAYALDDHGNWLGWWCWSDDDDDVEDF